jgi:3-deoxy-manno-octulosonate cytidylyltransferase (CMP-KDO synthetase)
LNPLKNEAVDISTLGSIIKNASECKDPNIVKAVVSLQKEQGFGRVLYFSREKVPYGKGPYYHHIGLYAYRRDSLRRFVNFPSGILEMRERLEQLRALENGLRIDLELVETVPLGVDTPADLEIARKVLASLKRA